MMTTSTLMTAVMCASIVETMPTHAERARALGDIGSRLGAAAALRSAADMLLLGPGISAARLRYTFCAVRGSHALRKTCSGGAPSERRVRVAPSLQRDAQRVRESNFSVAKRPT